jgi:glycosyltransferase involved in cell wall biosynthesis
MFRSVILPAYNESGYIEQMVHRTVDALSVRDDEFEVIVVDNASEDDTSDIVRRMSEHDERIKLIRHPENRLYAASCLTGTKASKGDRIFILDSDGQHSPDDLWNFDRVLDEGFDVVFGWRKEREESAKRLALSRILWLLTWWHLRYSLHDVNCGFRAFDRQFADRLEIKHRVNFVNPELYVRAKLGGFRIGEATTIQERRKAGESTHNFGRLWNIFSSVNHYLRSLASELHAGTS